MRHQGLEAAALQPDGFDVYLAKPVSPDDLTATVEISLQVASET